jgi:hypothetical protein
VITAAPGKSSPVAVYEGFRAQRRELNNQLEELQSTRREITSQMEDVGLGDAGRKPLENRLAEVDSRISTVDGMLAANAVQLSQAAAIPGAVVETPPIIRQGPPEEAYVLGVVFMLVALLPISIAFARRIWRRSAAAVTAFPRELADRLMRIEQGLEATSVEVERIGEGQRFLTRLFTEGESARSLGAGAAQRAVKAPERLP